METAETAGDNDINGTFLCNFYHEIPQSLIIGMKNNLKEGTMLISPWTQVEFHRGSVKQGFIPAKCSCVEVMDSRVAVWLHSADAGTPSTQHRGMETSSNPRVPHSNLKMSGSEQLKLDKKNPIPRVEFHGLPTINMILPGIKICNPLTSENLFFLRF